MNGGVLNAAEIMDESRLVAAISGYRFFGFDSVADLFSRANDTLDQGTADAVELERDAVSDIEVVLLEEDNCLGVLERQLDSEYARHIPDDSALFERFERHLTANPGDFASL